MKADWEDAPSRVRRKKNNKPIIIALVIAAGLATTALMATNLKWQVHDLAKVTIPGPNKPERLQLPEISTQDIKQTAEAAKDVYLEQVNNMLRAGTEYALCDAFKKGEGELAEAMRTQNCHPDPVAEMEWIDPEQKTSVERQTVFNDANYNPETTINTVRMAKPRPEPKTTRQQQQPYVTVVQETKMSCWPFKEGSADCRKYKALSHQHWRRKCDTGPGDQSYACRQANRYDLR